MSGGSLDYISFKIESILEKLRDGNLYYNAMADHLEKLAPVLHEIEWVLSGDRSPGNDNIMIEEFLGIAKIVEVSKQDISNSILYKIAQLNEIKAKL